MLVHPAGASRGLHLSGSPGCIHVPLPQFVEFVDCACRGLMVTRCRSQLGIFRTKRLGRSTASCPAVWAGASPNPEGPRCLENDGAGTCPFPDSTCKMNRTVAHGRMFWTKWSGTARQCEDSTSHEAIAYDTRRDGGDTVRYPPWSEAISRQFQYLHCVRNESGSTRTAPACQTSTIRLTHGLGAANAEVVCELCCGSQDPHNAFRRNAGHAGCGSFKASTYKAMFTGPGRCSNGAAES
jgi:hypothetical protein